MSRRSIRASGRVRRHVAGEPRGHLALRVLATTLTFLVAFAGTAVALVYHRLQTNINVTDIGDLLDHERPQPGDDPSQTNPDLNAGEALNILVIGSDTREGDNDVDGAGFDGTTSGMRSDTTMIVHLSADRSRVEAVSIPRDTLVEIPSCTLPDGTVTSPQSSAMFNSAFALGGQTGDVGAAAACTIKTVEFLTGVYMDDFVVIDFAGFMNVVDALGGIPMYIPEDIDDQLSGLTIEKGCRLLDGEQALGWARVRHIGDGSDISRIGRQQEFVMSVIREALNTRLLSNPTRLYQLLDAGTQTLSTGQKMGDLPAIVGLGLSFGGLDLNNVVFSTMPFYYQGARVVPAEEYVDEVWRALIGDTALDPLLSGEGSTVRDALAAREAATSPDVEWETASPTPSVEPTPDVETPAAVTPKGAAEEATVDPTAPTDPASACTRETAR